MMFTDDERIEVVAALTARLNAQRTARAKADGHYGRQVAGLRIGLIESSLGKLDAEIPPEKAPRERKTTTDEG